MGKPLTEVSGYLNYRGTNVYFDCPYCHSVHRHRLSEEEFCNYKFVTRVAYCINYPKSKRRVFKINIQRIEESDSDSSSDTEIDMTDQEFQQMLIEDIDV